MKTIHPAGVIRLAGYSFGASVAMEMALQLQQQGQCVQSLTLLDGSHSTAAVQTDSTRDRLPFVVNDNDVMFIGLFAHFVFRQAPAEVCFLSQLISVHSPCGLFKSGVQSVRLFADTVTQTLPPQADCSVNDTLIKVASFMKQSFFQIVDVTDLATVHFGTRTYCIL